MEIKEILEGMNLEQMAIVVVTIALCLFVIVKVAKTIMKIVLMALLVAVGYILFDEYAPTDLEMIQSKVEKSVDKAKSLFDEVKKKKELLED
ncbi:hypothetical protein [Sediminitomix flava]|uniref:Uncharacterized protein n=1 Tax=Sediminitomix flava TaxID=379075 RepID=A0A315ZH61_SEDFL|nr:hypothetical protein [Sediminitomix flava]PWJ44519.1 hypothetical protein BC781_101890 [Sediminitomix flava]